MLRCGICNESLEYDEAELWSHWYFAHAGDLIPWEDFLSSLRDDEGMVVLGASKNDLIAKHITVQCPFCGRINRISITIKDIEKEVCEHYIWHFDDVFIFRGDNNEGD